MILQGIYPINGEGGNTMSHNKTPGEGTMAVWAGEEEPCWEGATQVPVVHSVSFGYDDLDKWLEIGQGKARGHIYSRNTNPTDHEAIENAVSSGCKMLYLESSAPPRSRTKILFLR